MGELVAFGTTGVSGMMTSSQCLVYTAYEIVILDDVLQMEDGGAQLPFDCSSRKDVLVEDLEVIVWMRTRE